MRKRFDITGQIFGRITVLEYVGNSRYRCQCQCGNEFLAIGGNIRRGTTRSCGCLRREVSAQKSTSHGESGTRLHGIWKAMRKRCRNPNDSEYENYGARGITVCDEWDSSFEAFKAWALESGYKDHLSIDRIRVNDPYEPSNCRWATPKEQGRNKRKTVFVTIDGVEKPLVEWCEIFGVGEGTARHRMAKQGLRGAEIFQKKDLRFKE